MSFKQSLIFLCFISFWSMVYAKPIQVVTTIPDLAWVVREIGGEQVQVESMLRGNENPHYADALPKFVLSAANADMLCMVGLDLEVGYLPAILRRAANKRIMPGSPGHCLASKYVDLVDVIKGQVDRSMGDIHPHGNPHFYLSPSAMIAVAQEVKERLSLIRPQYDSLFQNNYSKFKISMESLKADILKKIKGLQQELIVMEYHKEFTYFIKDYALRSSGAVEEKPGVPPSARRLLDVSNTARAEKVQVLLAASYNPESVLQKFSELSDIPYVQLPTMLYSGGGIETYQQLQNLIADKLTQTLSNSVSTQKTSKNASKSTHKF